MFGDEKQFEVWILYQNLWNGLRIMMSINLKEIQHFYNFVMIVVIWKKHGMCHFLGHCYWQPPTQTKYISLAYYLTYIFTLYHVFWNLYPSPICIMDIIPLWCCHTTAILWHFVVFVIEWNKFVTFFLHIIVIRIPSPITNTQVWNF